MRWAGGAVRDENEMQAVMSTMAGLLEDAGLADEARTLLADKLAETTAPYYYMSWLGSLEAKAGNGETAVARYREAWQGARAAGSGAAMTPFRWGSSYLRRVLQHTPDSRDAVRDDGKAILAGAAGQPRRLRRRQLEPPRRPRLLRSTSGASATRSEPRLSMRCASRFRPPARASRKKATTPPAVAAVPSSPRSRRSDECHRSLRRARAVA